MSQICIPVTACLVLLALSLPVRASILAYAVGIDEPPAQLGGYTLTMFPDDPRPNGLQEFSLVSPLGGTMLLNPPNGVLHTEIGVGWASWSHDYIGDVYATVALASDKSQVSLWLPPNTGAFLVYTAPNGYGNFSFTVAANGQASLTQFASGDADARGFGFYSTAGESINLITITTDDPTGFAFGEMGIALVPEPRAFALFGAAAVMLLARTKLSSPSSRRRSTVC